jgi:hypothetical protein
MEAIIQFFAETLFRSASRGARRRRAAALAASLGLRFHADGRPDRADPAASGWLEELEMLGLRFTRPIADTFAGPYNGRNVIGFENLVWDRRRRRHAAYRFTAVALRRPGPDLLVVAAAEKAMVEQWFRPAGRTLPVPVPQDSDRTAAAADPAFADAVFKALADAGESPLEWSWAVRENWVIGWRRGRLRTRDAEDRLRFLLAAADALERA